MCHVTNQTNEYCNVETKTCNECGEDLVIDDNEDLVCDSFFCGEE